MHTYETSTANIVGGSASLAAFHASSVDISGGLVDGLYAYDFSTVDISDGTVSNNFQARASSTVRITGGAADYLRAYDSSTVDISGGSMPILYAYDTCTVTFHARDFVLDAALSLDGDRVLGTGPLSGEWLDGTPWTVNIMESDSGATIRIVPEPATLSLLTLGGLVMMRRKK